MAKTSAPSLEIKFAGIPFTSPIGVGAVGRPFGKNVTPELHAEILLKHAEAGASYIEIPTCVYATEETIRKIKAHAKPFKKPESLRMGMQIIRAYTPVAPYGVEGIYTLGSPGYTDPETGKAVGKHVEDVMEIVKKKKAEDVRVIANVLGYGDLPDGWVDSARRWEELGADLIEINVSCPGHPAMRGSFEAFKEKRFAAHWYGSVMSEMPDIVENITREVVKAVSIPVGVKFTPETSMLSIIDLAKRVKNAGAKWVQSTNAGITIAPPDIYNRGKSVWASTDGNPFIGTAGSWLRHITYRNTAAIAWFAPGLDIAAAGGIVTPQQCVEVMMLGARQIQLCTGILEKGRNLIRQCDSFLRKFMVEQGYNSLDEIAGLGTQYINYLDETDFSPGKFIAVTDDTKCTNCGVCADNFCTARYMENGQVKLNEEQCCGCGCCMVGCPVDAIKLERIT